MVTVIMRWTSQGRDERPKNLPRASPSRAHCVQWQLALKVRARFRRSFTVTGEAVAHIIGAVAAVLWVLVAAYALWILREPLTASVSRLAGVEAFGVKLSLSGGAAMNAAIELAQKNPAWPVEVPAADREAALNRANTHRDLFEGAEVLWVDDRPSNNRNEARMLRSFGALITFAVTTDEALRALGTGAEQHQPFDLILSDISRELPEFDPTAGLTMLPRLRDAGYHQPVIFYVGRPDPAAGVPAGAFGLTNRPDQLLQLTIDALSRVRGRA
jgi:CheY-like chemotaxis protein